MIAEYLPLIGMAIAGMLIAGGLMVGTAWMYEREYADWIRILVVAAVTFIIVTIVDHAVTARQAAWFRWSLIGWLLLSALIGVIISWKEGGKEK